MKNKSKIIVSEVLGTAASGAFEKRLGFRVLEIYNTTKYRIGEGLTKAEIDDALEFGNFTVVIRGQIYANKLNA